MSTYTKTTFTDNTTPGVSASELNKMGTGIADAHTELAACVTKDGGDTMTGSHTYTDATLDWSRDTDFASLYFSNDGADADHLWLVFGDNSNDFFRVTFKDSSAVYHPVVDFKGDRVDFYYQPYLSSSPLCVMKGGGTRLWAQSNDPGSSAGEGDVWVQG